METAVKWLLPRAKSQLFQEALAPHKVPAWTGYKELIVAVWYRPDGVTWSTGKVAP